MMILITKILLGNQEKNVMVLNRVKEGGVVNQGVALVVADIQRNRNAFTILAENNRVDIAIVGVAITDNTIHS